MASLPILSVLDQSQISPPPATVADTSLPLTFSDILFLRLPPIHFLFFYELPLTKTEFTETIVPNLKHSLSITLQHFYPFAGNLFLFPTRNKIPEIRYFKGDSVKVTFAECNLDFNDLTGNHPRKCDKFYNLIPEFGPYSKGYDCVKIPVFSLQVTLFPNHGISFGMTIHHSLVDATSQFCFLKAWTSIHRCGTDELFLANGTLPIYERLVKYPKLDESYLKRANVDTLEQPRNLSGPTDKVRATFVLKRAFIDQLKKHVLTQRPELPHVSSFTVACAYTWCCIAKARDDELEVFLVPLDCRSRLDPPIPSAYFGNCTSGSISISKTTILTGKEGFLTAAKLIGENLHKTLTEKDGILKDIDLKDAFSAQGVPTTVISVAGSPKIKLYDLDFGWGKPKKLERIHFDYRGASISMDAGKECEQDLEIGVCLSATEMQVFVRVFNQGLEPYI